MPKLLPKNNKLFFSKSFVPISKAAKFLQVSPDTLRNWERQGRLLPSRTNGGARRYSTAELEVLKKEINPVVVRKKGLVSVSHAAKALKTSPDTLRSWDKKGLIESSRSKGGARRFTRDEITRLQKELGIEAVEAEANSNLSHNFHNFSHLLYKISFPIILFFLVLSGGWFVNSYVSPLEKKIDDTSKLLSNMTGSIESLQRGVLGIQTQPHPTPSPLVVPSNVNQYFINSKEDDLRIATQEPLSINIDKNEISCPSCLTGLPDFISSIGNSDGALKLDLNDKQVTASLNMDHKNSWSAAQSFIGGLFVNAPTGDYAAVFKSGNVGIGVTSPGSRLQVTGDSGNIFSVSTSALSLFTVASSGNVGIGLTSPAYRLDVSGGARFACNDNNWGDGPKSSCADVAEVYQSDGSVEEGEIVVAFKQDLVSRSVSPYQKEMLGVFSQSPALLIGGETVLGGSSNLSAGQIPVALAGRVPVKVSDENGSIEVGDYLTSSSIPGVAMKATKPGPVLGQALESFAVPAGPLLSPEGEHLVDIRLKFGKILTFVNVSFADPQNFLSSLTMDDQGNLIVPKLKAGSIILDSNLDSRRLTVENSSTIYPLSSTVYYDLSGKIARLDALIESQRASVEERIAALENVIASSANAYLPGETEATSSSHLEGVTGTATSSGSLTTDYELPASQRGEPTTNSEATSSAFTLLAEAEKLVSTENGQQESTYSASISYCALHPEACNLNLTPPDVLIASSSALLADLKVTDTFSSERLLTAEDVKISGELNVFGKTTLASTFIAGDLTVDGTTSLSGNSINSISCSSEKNSASTEEDCGILYVQNSHLAAKVDFFNGSATIDKTGHLKAQIVTVAEFRVIANKISGRGKISAGTKSIDIENVLVKPSSRILITPTDETTFVLAVTTKEEGKKFTVSSARAISKDLNFDWFLINETESN